MANDGQPSALAGLEPLVGALRQLIQQARDRALRAVDVIQVQTCWQVGRHIVEFEQGGAARAAYGTHLLPLLAEQLTAEFGKGFDERNLRHMRAFFLAFPIWNAVRSELSWTHYRLLSRVENEVARHWYMNEAAEHSVVRYSVLHESEQLFASRYKLVLPTEEELRAEIERESEALRLAMILSKEEPNDD
jgi:hypothetical protein